MVRSITDTENYKFSRYSSAKISIELDKHDAGGFSINWNISQLMILTIIQTHVSQKTGHVHDKTRQYLECIIPGIEKHETELMLESKVIWKWFYRRVYN